MHQTHPLHKYFQALVKRELSALNSDDLATPSLSADSQRPNYLILDILVDRGISATDDLEHLQKTCEQKKQKYLRATMQKLKADSELTIDSQT
jgi:hypothetical protein